MISSEKDELADASMIKEVRYRIAVINSSGNTGKSLASDYLLRPRMDLQSHYVINNMSMYNKTYSDEIVLSGGSFDEVLKALSNLDSAIVDIAAHNTGCVINIMQNNSDSHQLFDYFLVPVIKGIKESEDSLNTIKALLKLGVPAESIKLIFNNINTLEVINDEFEYLLSHLDELKIPYDTNAVIKHNPFYPKLSELDTSLLDQLPTIIAEKNVRRNYLRTKQNPERTEEESEELKLLVDLITTLRGAKPAVQNLNDVYHLLFAKS